jgi:hypothetical protein
MLATIAICAPPPPAQPVAEVTEVGEVRRVSVRAPQTGKTFVTAGHLSRGRFWAVFPIPADLPSADLGEHLLPSADLGEHLRRGIGPSEIPLRPRPDPSLARLLDILLDRGASQWTEGSPTLPTTYCTVVDGNTYRALFALYDSQLQEGIAHAIGSQGKRVQRAWLVYFGHNHLAHGSQIHFRTLDEAEGLKLLATEHAVVVAGKSRHAWVFISDGLYKLRHRSIESARLVRDTKGLRVEILQRRPSGTRRIALPVPQ